MSYGSITVPCTWELTSVSMRYSQGKGVNTSLSRTVYCNHESYIILCRSFPVCEWVCSVARSCATKDANNKDYVYKPSIPAGINCPPPSKTTSPITWFGTISTILFLPNLRCRLIGTTGAPTLKDDELHLGLTHATTRTLRSSRPSVHRRP